MEEREISISPMFKWLTKRFDKKGKKVRKTRLLWGREFKTVKKGLDEEQVVDFVSNLIAEHKASQQASAASLHSLIKKVVIEAEQIAASIKMKAQQEAETEAERIISQAKQEVQEIKLSAEIATEAKIATEKETTEETMEQPVQLEEETTVPEPVAVTAAELVEQHPPEEKPGGEETDSAQLKSVDSQALYTGEVELAIAMPVELKMVSKLYNYLQTIPEIKILRTTGSWDRGTAIAVVLDKPIPLISIISKIPDVEVIPELSQKDSSVKGTSRSLLRAEGKGVRRITLTLKEAQPR